MIRMLVFMILRLMGIKKIFSQDPIPVEKLRKSDVLQPSKKISRTCKVVEKQIGKARVMAIKSKESENEKDLILFFPGGAFISGPAQHHWDVVNKIATTTKQAIWVIDYPKAPESNILTINESIEDVFKQAIQQIDVKNISLIGDSVGANLIMSLLQRQIEKQEDLPKQLLLITPVFDSSCSNADMSAIEHKDPILSIAGVKSAKLMAADGLDLKDPRISPLYGSFQGFPRTVVYLGGHDINYPDGKIAIKKMKQQGVDLQVIDEPLMPHIFPYLPLLSGNKNALPSILHYLHNTNT